MMYDSRVVTPEPQSTGSQQTDITKGPFQGAWSFELCPFFLVLSLIYTRSPTL